MLVVLDLSAPCYIKQGVQYCNCPEGFLSIQEMHPEDTFCFADEESRQSFIALMDFMETMGWTLDVYYAERNHLDEIECIEAFCDDDYDYWLECSQDAMWIKNNC